MFTTMEQSIEKKPVVEPVKLYIDRLLKITFQKIYFKFCVLIVIARKMLAELKKVILL